ncbi:MAG: 2-succinyl-5-enolpyruvyl-6-hydroxy-3-cyclohexene-1-carboxylic-acid synthase [Bacillota bacterium]
MKINRNIVWSDTFINKLANLGVKYACVSPGSRNTPLTLALSRNDKIRTYVHIDERSSGFFALGIARSTKTPVLLICTSGTAAAEFYPAIIEAFQQRIPLIVCTADRPPELIGRGANQTIFQDNIYKNHIRWFINAGLPEPTRERLEYICRMAERAVLESTRYNPGPVHINFPFRKPFEPSVYTDEIDESLIEIGGCISNQVYRRNDSIKDNQESKEIDRLYNEVISSLKSNSKGLIIAGPGSFGKPFNEICQQLAEILNYPVIADVTSQLRFSKSNKSNLLVNYEGYIATDEFLEKYSPGVILQFGRTTTSKAMELFFEKLDSRRYYLINENGEFNDPYNKARAVLRISAENFCEKAVATLRQENFSHSDRSSWLDKFIAAECKAEAIKKETVENAEFPFEGRIITEIIKLMPDESALMVSNSMPVRDLDYFAPKSDKSIRVFHNRGASGIDGITSTALGISEGLRETTVLITGDLAFYYDLNGLLASLKYSIPLVVVLINNDGGGIFQMLPIARCEESQNAFDDFFITPHGLDFSVFVKAYGGNFTKAESWEDLKTAFESALRKNGLSVIQVNTDARCSAKIRKDYWKMVGKSF